MIDIESIELSQNDEKRLQNKLVGGVILFSRNYKNKKQITSLITSIRKVKKNILIAVDHEGGRVQRFKDHFTLIPAMSTLGDLFIKSPESALKKAKEKYPPRYRALYYRPEVKLALAA